MFYCLLIRIFAPEIKCVRIMTAIELNAQIWRDMAEADLVRLAKNEPKAFAKAQRFIEELKVHPKTGLGHPEPLKGKPEG